MQQEEVMITKSGNVCLLERVSRNVVRRKFVRASPLPEKRSPRRTDDCEIQPDEEVFLGPTFGRKSGTRQCHIGSGRGRPSKKQKRRAR